VVSKTLNDSAVEKNARIVRTNLQDEILKLKKEEGGNIIAGGVSIPSQLINLGLVSQINIVVNHIFVGGGTRLLEGFSLERKLKLVDTKSLKSGSVLLRYLKSENTWKTIGPVDAGSARGLMICTH